MLKTLVAAAAISLAASQAVAADRLTILLDWFINPDHAPLIIAEARGEFAARDLDVEIVAPADPSAPPRLVAAGQGDIAITYQPNLYQQADEGLRVKRIGTLVESPLNALVVLADGPIRELSDLQGTTVGFSVGGFEDALLGRMLSTVDLTLDDVTLVNVNFALTPALISGQVDAVIGAFRNFELTQLRIAGSAGRAFFPEEHGVPNYEELIFIARADRAREDVMARFMDAIAVATKWQAENQAEAEEIFFEVHPELDDELNRNAFIDTLPKFPLDPIALDTARYETFATFMTEAGLVDNLPPLSDYTVDLSVPATQ